MTTLPKTFAEILASAKNSSQRHSQHRKLKTNLKQDFQNHLSTFAVDPSVDTSCTTTSVLLQSGPTLSNVHAVGSTYFNNPTTLQTLEAALKLKETKDNKETEDLFDDESAELADTWVMSCILYSVI